MFKDEYNINKLAIPNNIKSSREAYLNNCRNGTGAIFLTTITTKASLNN